MSSSSSLIFLDPSFTESLLQYGGGSVPLEALVWQRYVALQNIDVSKPLTDPQRQDFDLFFTLYQSLGLTKEALDSAALPPSTSNYIRAYQEAKHYLQYTGLFPDDNLQNSIIIKDLWNGFLKKYNLTPAQAEQNDLSALFSTYVHDLFFQPITPSSAAIRPPEDVLQIALWNRFLTAYGYSPTDTSTTQQRKEFSAFLQQYQMWNIDTAVLQSTNELPSGEGSEFFTSLLNAFYGNLSSIEQKDLWNRFLLLNGMQSNPTDLASYQSSFVDFLQMLQAKKGRFEAATSVTPSEQSNRKLFGTVMESLSNMLLATEGVVRTNSDCLMLYSKWQKELTEQMTRVPAVIAIPPEESSTSPYTTIQLPSSSSSPMTYNPNTKTTTYWDLSNFTLGYNKLSLHEVISWAYDTLLQKPNETITFKIGSLLNISLSNTHNADGSPAISLAISLSCYDGVNDQVLTSRKSTTVSVQNSSGRYLTADGTGSIISQVDAFDDSLTLIEHGFCSMLNDIKTGSSTDKAVMAMYQTGIGFINNKTHYIQGLKGDRSLTDTNVKYTVDPITGNKIVDTTGLQERQEQNALLQNYVSMIRAKRLRIQSSSQTIQSSLQTARLSINKIANLWISILEAISTIVRSLYK